MTNTNLNSKVLQLLAEEITTNGSSSDSICSHSDGLQGVIRLAGKDEDLNFLSALFLKVLSKGMAETYDVRLALLAADAIKIPHTLRFKRIGAKLSLTIGEKRTIKIRGYGDLTHYNAALLKTYKRNPAIPKPTNSALLHSALELADAAGLKAPIGFDRKRFEDKFNTCDPDVEATPRAVCNPAPGNALSCNFYDYAIQLGAIGEMIGRAYYGEEPIITTYDTVHSFETEMQRGEFLSAWKSKRTACNKIKFTPIFIINP